MFQIVHDRLVVGGRPAAFVPSPHHGGRIRPRVIVIHDTAGTTAAGAISWFQSERSKVSAHFVVERDGAVTQMVECDVKAWHAGKSSYRGTPNVNDFGVGIEIVNPGLLFPRNGRVWHYTFKQSWALGEVTLADSKPHGGEGWWLPYTAEQLKAVERLVRALAIAYPSIVDVVGHYEISPGRKVDPGPHFDLDRLRAILADREEPDTGTVADAQDALAGLGYFAGSLDGVMGPLTEAAILSFQHENGLAKTAKLDAATLEWLTDPRAKSLPIPAREDATKDDVKAAGSETMTQAAVVKRGAEVSGALEATNAVSQILTQAEQAKDTSDRSVAMIDWLASPAGIKSAVTLLVIGAIWFAANRIEWARVRDFVLGKNLGR